MRNHEKTSYATYLVHAVVLWVLYVVWRAYDLEIFQGIDDAIGEANHVGVFLIFSGLVAMSAAVFINWMVKNIKI